METNTLRIGIPTMIVAQVSKKDWNRLWNPIQRVYKGVATTYFHANTIVFWAANSSSFAARRKKRKDTTLDVKQVNNGIDRCMKTNMSTGMSFDLSF
jgi:hypothetical protein